LTIKERLFGDNIYTNIPINKSTVYQNNTWIQALTENQK